MARPSGTTLQLAVNSRKYQLCAILTADNIDGKSRKSIVSEKSPTFRPALFHAHAILCLNVQCVCCHCWVLLIDCAALTFSKSSIDCAVPVYKGPFKCYVTPIGVGVSNFPGEKRYEGLRFNVISITRGGWGSNFQEKSVTKHMNGP